ncbi:MAG: hypothetical protein IPI44_12630 [Sulfuritalea sp.]|nr:hypothetical protein [Sulfuritalea sp.]
MHAFGLRYSRIGLRNRLGLRRLPVQANDSLVFVWVFALRHELAGRFVGVADFLE